MPEFEPRPVGVTTKDKDNDDDQGGNMPIWIFKEKFNQEEILCHRGTTGEECVAGPFVRRDQANKSKKVHPLKVKDTMSRVYKSTIKDFQKKNSTL